MAAVDPEHTSERRNHAIDERMADAVEAAMRRVLADNDLRSAFWRSGYEELSAHAGNGASQWIGKRLLIAAVWAVVSAGLIWLVKIGAFK